MTYTGNQLVIIDKAAKGNTRLQPHELARRIESLDIAPVFASDHEALVETCRDLALHIRSIDPAQIPALVSRAHAYIPAMEDYLTRRMQKAAKGN